MGNCIKKESATQWGGDDWGSPASETLFSGDKSDKAELGSPFSSSAAKKGTTEVKIKITKKQLEELLGRVESVDAQGLSVQQLLAQLMDGSDRFETHQRSWRPALQSIPEVN